MADIAATLTADELSIVATGDHVNVPSIGES
jgi:hypothetical protein